MKHKESIMKNMTRTFKSNPLPMHRDFVSKQLMGARINQHRKAKHVQLQNNQHIEKKLDIIEICKSISSFLIIIFRGIMNGFNNITIIYNTLLMMHKHRRFITLYGIHVIIIIIIDSNFIVIVNWSLFRNSGCITK